MAGTFSVDVKQPYRLLFRPLNEPTNSLENEQERWKLIKAMRFSGSRTHMGSRTLRPISVAHPGETVVNYLDSHGWTQRELSRRSGLTPKTVSEICNGKAPVSSSTSIAFERVFGRPAHFWMNLQGRFDEAQARRAEPNDPPSGRYGSVSSRSTR